jgi:hypothetical protein
MEKSRIRDGKKSDPGSGINIPDPQHCLYLSGYFARRVHLSPILAAAAVAGTTARAVTDPCRPTTAGRSRNPARTMERIAAAMAAPAAAVDRRVAASAAVAAETRRLIGRSRRRGTRSWRWSSSGWGTDPAASTLTAMRISRWRPQGAMFPKVRFLLPIVV